MFVRVKPDEQRGGTGLACHISTDSIPDNPDYSLELKWGVGRRWILRTFVTVYGFLPCFYRGRLTAPACDLQETQQRGGGGGGTTEARKGQK